MNELNIDLMIKSKEGQAILLENVDSSNLQNAGKEDRADREAMKSGQKTQNHSSKPFKSSHVRSSEPRSDEYGTLVRATEEQQEAEKRERSQENKKSLGKKRSSSKPFPDIEKLKK